MTSWIKFLLGLQEPQQRTQALAFERSRQGTPAVRKSMDDVVRSLDSGDTVSVFELPDRRVNISRKLLFRHAALLGTTGGGKTMAAMSLLVALLDQALDASVLSGKPLAIEITVIDIKDDIHRFKQRIAAIYHVASPAKQKVMLSAFHMIQWQSNRITLLPLLVPRAGVSIEYVAEHKSDIVVQTSPSIGRTRSGSCSSRCSGCSFTTTSDSTAQR
jgi:hypothetical protein